MLTEVLGATREEMRDAKLPLAYRDSCAHLLIPLNRCRVDTYYLPWKCNVSNHPALTHETTSTLHLPFPPLLFPANASPPRQLPPGDPGPPS